MAVDPAQAPLLAMIAAAKKRGRKAWRGARQVVVLGGGVAGCAAALYLARSQIDVAMVADGYGQLTMSENIQNYPGVRGPVTGEDLVQSMSQQAMMMGAERVEQRVAKLDVDTYPFTIHTTANATLHAFAVIIATGATTRWLQLPGEAEFIGKSVHTCPLCDGSLYQNKAVVVVGGGDSAFETAVYMSKIARVVFLVHRRGTFRASGKIQSILKQAAINFDALPKTSNGSPDPSGITVGGSLPNIVLAAPYVVTSVDGVGGAMTGVMLQRPGNAEGSGAGVRVDADGMFVNIGSTPNIDFLPKDRFEQQPSGHLQCGKTATNVPGVFGAGEVADCVYRQAVTAAGSGAAAAMEVEQWLDDNRLCGAGKRDAAAQSTAGA